MVANITVPIAQIPQPNVKTIELDGDVAVSLAKQLRDSAMRALRWMFSPEHASCAIATRAVRPDRPRLIVKHRHGQDTRLQQAYQSKGG